MNILGIIAEYNPFHNGHIHHINEAKRITNSDICICVMSSTFTMRGDLSIIDKFTKTKECLSSGIDIIIELPFAYTVSSSNIFAKKAMEILNQFKVNSICFGSETNDIFTFKEAYNNWNNNQDKIKELVNQGFSYKYATSKVLNLLANDILGFNYYKEIIDNNYDISVYTIKREGNNYNDENITNSKYQSAKAIRNNLEIFKDYTPSFPFLDNYTFLDESKLYSLFQYKVITSSIDDLQDLYLVDEGIENLFKKNIMLEYQEFLKACTNKRYTTTRIKRTMLFILFNIKRIDMLDIINNKINYIRVLGFNTLGKEYINRLKKEINIITNIKEGINNVYDIEYMISKVISSVYKIDLDKNEQKGPIIIL